MPTLFTHPAIGIFASLNLYRKKSYFYTVTVLSVLCTILPDADVIGFKLGVPYESFFGHRGFFHSIFFAVLLSAILTIPFLFSRTLTRIDKTLIFITFLLSSVSHGLLDGLTDGGYGIAFFSPFDTTRYFFDTRPIPVSPIGIKNFFNERGLHVVLSELQYVVLPIFITHMTLYPISYLYRKLK